MKKANGLHDVQTIAASRGGQCLADAYVDTNTKLPFVCAQGHQFASCRSYLKAGNWCPYCIGKGCTLADLHALAAKQEGRCLSRAFLGMKEKHLWECAEGHTWETTPQNVKYGSWCPICGRTKSDRNRRRYSIDDMQCMAQARGGCCLSDVFESVRKKLAWQCSEGHTWEAKPDNIQRGTWCPQCANTSKYQRGTRRICATCGAEKDESSFRLRMRKKTNHLYRHSQCHDCESKSRKEWGEAHPDYKRRRYAANPEKYREERRIYYANNTEECLEATRSWRVKNPDHGRLYSQEWREKHRDNLPALNKKWRHSRLQYYLAYSRTYNPIYYLLNREAILKRVRAYAKANPEKVMASVLRRIARMRGASGSIETIQHLEIAERDKWICHICHTKVTRQTWSLDHLIPLSKGGTHTKLNVALAHRRCNSKRGVGRVIPAQLRLF